MCMMVCRIPAFAEDELYGVSDVQAMGYCRKTWSIGRVQVAHTLDLQGRRGAINEHETSLIPGPRRGVRPKGPQPRSPVEMIPW